MITMTARQRELTTLTFGTPDVVPLSPGWGRKSTRSHWHATGLPVSVDPVDIPEHAYRQAGGILPWPAPRLWLSPNERMIPQFEEKIIEERGDTRVDPTRSSVQTGRERHGYCRPHNLGNPMRSLVTDHFLYIHNFTPERPIHDCDLSPTRTLIESWQTNPYMEPYYDLCFGTRPAEELYLATDGPDCIRNVASDPTYAALLSSCREQLNTLLTIQEDPRILNGGSVFECAPYYGRVTKIDLPPLPSAVTNLPILPLNQEA